MSEPDTLATTKRFVNRHFEHLLVLVLVVSLLLINYYIDFKLAFLSFYYLPVILAGFLVGRAMAVGAAVLVVSLAGFMQAAVGLDGPPGFGTAELAFLVPWGGFLVLTAFVVGTLADQRRLRTEEVRATYLTMMEMLSIQLDSGDRMRRGHSYRVGERAVQLARELGLGDSMQEDLRVAGLLHEVGPQDPRLTRLMSDLPASKDARVTSIRRALKLVDEYGHYHEIVSARWPVDQSTISLGTKILAVADAFETLQTPTSSRPAFAPWNAMEEIERGAGSTFGSEVVRALRQTATVERADTDRSALRIA